MKTCICCHKRSREIIGPRCGTLKCKCIGVKCPHDGARLRLYKIPIETSGQRFDLAYVKCDECGCAWTGRPDKSELQVSFTCKYVEGNMYYLDPVPVS